MSNGWIKLHRKMLENPLWCAEEFTKGQAWIDLLMLANFSDNKIIVRGVVVEIKRGQVGWSEVKLCERWKWSRGKTSRFLNMLESEHQIIQQKDNISSIITILNYDSYQLGSIANRTTDEQQVEQQTDTKQDSRQDTNKNDKNEENEKNKEDITLFKSSRSKFSDIEKPADVDQKIWDDWLKIRRAKKAPVTQTAFNLIIREAEKAKMSVNDALRTAVENGWQGFKAEWMTGSKFKQTCIADHQYKITKPM